MAVSGKHVGYAWYDGYCDSCSSFRVPCRAVLGIVLGLGASVCWGVSDFVGGYESRRAPQAGVMLAGATVGCLVLALFVVLGGTSAPGAKYLLDGIGGGAAVTVALFAFYRALAIGVMSVVAPIAATGVVVPVIVGIADGERPGYLRLCGAVLAIVGVAAVSRQKAGDERSVSASGMSIVLALVAALGFGTQFVALHAAAKGDALWGALMAVVTYLVLVTIIAAVTTARGGQISPGRSRWPCLLVLGIAFGSANALYASATRHGQLTAVSVVSSLYPVVTVLLARAILAERVRPLQELGILLALGGIVLIAAGG
jgi:drug/metabolite transporter (DMT)-like permease